MIVANANEFILTDRVQMTKTEPQENEPQDSEPCILDSRR